MNYQDVSKKSNDFLGDLCAYLRASGKNEKEINDIVEELHDHLKEAEKKGKSVEDIIGRTPKEYMKSVAREMKLDWRQAIQYMFLLVAGVCAFSILSKLTKGDISYSVLQLSGFVGIVFLSIIVLVISFKQVTGLSSKKQLLIIWIWALLPTAAFLGLFFLERSGKINTPIIHFGTWGSWAAGGISLLLLIAFSIWARTWVLIFAIMLLTLPDFVLSKTDLTKEYQALVSLVVLIMGSAILFWIAYRDNIKERPHEKHGRLE